MNKSELYRKAVKLKKETNRRLSRLNKGVDLNKGKYNPKTKRFERIGTITTYNKKGKKIRIKTTNVVNYKMGTWSTKALRNRINKYLSKKGEVIIPTKDNITTTDLVALIKAMNNFLKSKTSTIKGIQEVEKQTKQNIANILDVDFDDIDQEITDEEVNILYDFFNDEDFNYIVKEAGIPPSELIIAIHTAKYNHWSKERFLNEIKNYNPDNTRLLDLDIAEALENIYNKLIKYDIL